MKLSPLPFEILGQIGPILAWAEGGLGGGLPESWNAECVPFDRRERSWLLRELPTYSYDNVDDIVAGVRASHDLATPGRLPSDVGPRRPSLAPPPGYDLLEAFRSLYRHFFVWSGTELCVQEGRMENLHELAIRMPAGHIVRHGHARAVAEGVLTTEEALQLPELVTLLPSNAFGLRSVVRRGLCESHLHLRGVTSAEETWADNLLRPLSATAIRAEDPAERRILVLNLFCGQLLALAIWCSFERDIEPLAIRPRRLLGLLDGVYFARSAHEERVVSKRFEDAVRQAVGGAHNGRGLLACLPPAAYRFLLRWAAPGAYSLGNRGAGNVAGAVPEDLARRYGLVHQLHLGAHQRLLELTPGKRPRRDRRSAAPENDPAGRWYEDSDRRRIPPGRRDFLHQALFRYLVCRTHHWQLATQQGRTTGLRYFRQQFGSAQRKPRHLSSVQYAALVFDRLRQWRGLRVLEGRVSPPRRAEELVPWLLAFARQHDRRIRKFGMVVHFKKEDEAREEKGFSRRIHSPAPRIRWGRWRRMVREEGRRLYRLLRRPTPVTPFVVGIDACNLELATPPEVFAPVFRFLRDLPIRPGSRDRRFTPYFKIDASIRRLVECRRLGLTYHVGEDFRHLLSGLRAIDEVVRFLGPKPGDRLGHGTALALDPGDWLEHNGYQAVMPALEWLDTLVWVHHFLGPGDNLVGELAIEDKIQRLSWQIYSQATAGRYDPLNLSRQRKTARTDAQASPAKTGAEHQHRRGLLDWDWSPLTLWDAWTLRQLDPYSVSLPALFQGKLELKPITLHTEETRRWREIQGRVRAEVCQHIGSRNAFFLLALYWADAAVRKNGEVITVVDMQPQHRRWLALCRRVEKRMRQRIHEKELVVEVNPSSNRIIGPMASYRQHHVFHLTLNEDKRLKREVRVSVNSDNPAVCNTTLAHEYYLLGELLIADDVPEAEVVEWLEWLRENGETYNFVSSLETAENDPDMGRVLAWMRAIRPSVLEERTRKGKHQAFWRWWHETRLRGHGFSQDAIRTAPIALDRLIMLEALESGTATESDLARLRRRVDECSAALRS